MIINYEKRVENSNKIILIQNRPVRNILTCFVVPLSLFIVYGFFISNLAIVYKYIYSLISLIIGFLLVFVFWRTKIKLIKNVDDSLIIEKTEFIGKKNRIIVSRMQNPYLFLKKFSLYSNEKYQPFIVYKERGKKIKIDLVLATYNMASRNIVGLLFLEEVTDIAKYLDLKIKIE